MRTAAKIIKALMWTVFIIYTAMQGLTLYALIKQNHEAVKAQNAENYYNIIPLIVAVALMLLAVIVFTILKKHRYIGFIVGMIAASVMLVVAMDLGRTFSINNVTSSYETGVSTFELFYRHIGISLIPILMIPAWLFERKADKDEKLAMEAMKEKPGYHFTDETIFTDVDANGNVKDNQGQPHRLKRSLRKKYGEG